MPFFEYEMLHKLLTPAEEKKIQVFVNYISFDIFSDKIAYQTFKERMEILNQQKHFDLFAIFKEICGKNRKYITYPRFVEAFMGYQLNSSLYSFELKNFMAFVNNELVFDYNSKYLGNSQIKGMKEFSTKNMINRKSLTNFQVFTNVKSEIVGLQLTYDEKYKNFFIAPEAQNEFYEMKINCNLKINTDFIEESEKNNPDADHDFARDYITHIYGTHSHIIESIGFKTAFGKHYYTGNPTKGKQFLLGTTKKKFHYLKFGMKTHLNCCAFKFLPAMHNPNLTTKIYSFTDEDYDRVFPEEEGLELVTDENEKNQIISIPLHNPKDFLNKEFLEGDFSGDSLCDIAISDNSDLEDDTEKNKIYHIINKLSEDKYKVLLKENYEILQEKKKEAKRKKKEEKKKERAKKTYESDEEFPDLADITNEDLLTGLKEHRKVTVEDIRFKLAKDIMLNEISSNTTQLESFFFRYSKAIKEELEEQVQKQEKINQMKNDFYIRYLNRNKSPKDWELIELDTKYDPLKLKEEYSKIMKLHEHLRVEDEEIPEELYDQEKLSEEITVNNWRKMCDFLKRKRHFIYLRQFSLSLAKDILVEKERGESYRDFDLKDKITVMKFINKLKCDKKMVRRVKKEDQTQPKPKTKKSKTVKEDILSITKNQAKNFLAKSKTFKDDHMDKAKKDIDKLLEKKKTRIETPPYTDKEILALWREYVDCDLDYLLKNLHKEREIVHTDIKEYNKLLKLGICGEATEEIENVLEDLKRMRVWFDNKINQEAKSISKKRTNIDEDEHRRKEIERRRLILEQNKSKKMEEKAAEEEKLTSQLLDPVKTGDLIKADSSVKIYRNQVVPQEGKFIDDLFKAETSTLCPIDENEEFVLPESCEPQDIEGFEDYSWTNFEKIFHGKNYQVFLDKIEENDIIQGSLGDCYFLSAIAALTKFPDLIKGLFLFQERSEEGCYGVKYRVNGNWKIVLVDEAIPGDGGCRPSLAFSAANGNELWVVLLEKAWAKLCGNFAKACAGLPNEVFDCISNSVSEIIDLNPKKTEEVWAKLKEGKEKNFIMTAGTGGDESIDYSGVNLEVGHAYTVLDSYEIVKNGIKVKLVKLRNPWGNSEYSGDWCDSSDLWDDKLRRQVGLTDADDGVFFMSLEDFLTYYVIFSVCRIYPEFTNSPIKVNKEKTKEPVVHILDIKEDGIYIVQVHQKNPRFQSKDGSYPSVSLCYIMLLDDKHNYIDSRCSDYHTEGFECVLKKGKYYVITDVSYRYSQNQKLHSYTVSSLGVNPGEFYTCEENVEEIIEKGLYSYAASKSTPTICDNTKELGGVEKYTVSDINKFPYIFNVYNNKTKQEIATNFKLKVRKNNKDCEFSYNPTAFEVKKVIKPGEQACFVVRKFSMYSQIEYSSSINIIYSDDEVKKLTQQKGTSEKLDRKGEISLKTFQYDGGYGLIVENLGKADSEINFIFELKNLVIKDSDDKEVKLNLKPKENRFIHLKTIDATKGFAYAYQYTSK